MRKDYIDNAKGIGIILVVFGHTMTFINPIHQWIYSFHMPLFFVIGGILISMQSPMNSNQDRWNFIKRRIISAGIPYFFFGIILALFYSSLEVVVGEKVTLFQNLLRIITLKGVDSLWFIPPYILGIIIMTLAKSFGTKNQFLLSLVCFGIVLLKATGLNIPVGEVTYKVLIGICFIEIGIVLVQFKLLEKINLTLLLLLILVGVCCCSVNGEVEMAFGNIGNPWIYYLGATCTSYSIIYICYKKSSLINHSTPYLRTFGKYSMVTLSTNNLIIEVIRLVDYKLTGNILIRLGFYGSILFTIVILIVEWILINQAKGKLGFVFGYLPKRKEEK